MARSQNFDLPTKQLAEDFGLRFGSKGTHTSRTIMLAELTQLLESVSTNSSRDDYVRAVTEANITDKKTVATRLHTIQRLSELYGLDPSIPLFRVLRRLWEVNALDRPLLVILTALARDPLFRLTVPVIQNLKPGDELTRQAMFTAVQSGVAERLNPNSVDKVVRNASSSWTQSGHLVGRMRKIRQRVSPTALSVTYALLLGYLEGGRGASLLRTPWVRILDAMSDQLVNLARDAKRLGFLDMKQAGDVVEFGFAPLLTSDELRDRHGTN